MMKSFLTQLLFCLCCFYQTGYAQTPAYPKNYFNSPVDFPILLAGNFGECRTGHFHSGIDIKTKGVENQVVRAAADGYISRIKMEKGGFGHALYITHANGYTTLYAHLNDFIEPVQKYIRKQQYQYERYEMDVNLTPDQFPVKQGQQIAWSGNTGASTAPHLHFEIRDSKTEHPVNPQLFGFTIVDRIPPVPTLLAIYDGTRSIYEQEPLQLTLKKKGDKYVPLKDTIVVDAGITGIGLVANDYMNNSESTIAFYTAEWQLDDKVQGRIRLDDIGYDETRYMHAYADYRQHYKTDKWIQCLFQLPGNRLNRIYESLNENKGKLNLMDGRAHQVQVVLTDDANNESVVSFYIRSKGEKHPLTCSPLFKPNTQNRFEQPDIKLALDETQLYDNICFLFNKKPDSSSYSYRYAVHDPSVPVHHYFDLLIKPFKPIPMDLRNKMVLLNNDGKTEEGKMAQQLDKGWYMTSIRNFGEFKLVADTIAPVIKPTEKKKGIISFYVKDNMTSVKKFRAVLENGQWLMFEPRGDYFSYRFDEYCPPGDHKLSITAIDENGNTRSFVYSFNNQ